MQNEELRKVNKALASETAMRCMIEHGIFKTTKDMVAKRSGLSTASIARYFPTKDSMVEAAAEYVTLENAEHFHIDKKAFDKLSGKEQYRHLAANILNSFIEYPEPFILCSEMIMYAYRNDELTKESMADWIVQMRYRPLMIEALEKGLSDGSFHFTEPAEKVADRICEIFFSYMAHQAIGRNFDDPTDVEEVKKTLTQIFEWTIEAL